MGGCRQVRGPGLLARRRKGVFSFSWLRRATLHPPR